MLNIKDMLLLILLAHLRASMEGESFYVVPSADGPVVHKYVDKAVIAYIRVSPQGRIECVTKVGPKTVDFRYRHAGFIFDFYA